MEAIFGKSFTADDIPDLAGKVYLVTGGAQGIGFGTTYNLLKHNATKVIIISRNPEIATEAKETLAKELGPDVHDRVQWIQCNLSNLPETDEVAKKIARSERRLDCIVANAGIGIDKYSMGPSGIEEHMAANHFGHFILIQHLMPLIKENNNKFGTPGRVVVTCSENHRWAKSDTKFASVDECNEDIGPTYLYNRAKLANILMARQLIKHHLSGPNPPRVYINSIHPGVVATTQQHVAADTYDKNEGYGVLPHIAHAVIRPFLKDIFEGCISECYAATSPEIEEKEVQGKYIMPPNSIKEGSSMSLDEELGDQLWRLSIQVVKDKTGTVFE
ncbi:NAD(P)-binding protein [Saitoella complicata NRRL Y-17804]|nr:NAD(P)-binding protein [Saitoella complicata NRRL Y-17804]ODQ50283.1 NAD(P)-binding protein [Saitoella complicata NRRL Y-17804]